MWALFWAADSQSMWWVPHPLLFQAQGQQGAGTQGRGRHHSCEHWLSILCWMILSLTLGETRYSSTCNCCCGIWKQSCNSELLCPGWVSWGACASAGSVFWTFLDVWENLSYFCQGQHPDSGFTKMCGVGGLESNSWTASPLGLPKALLLHDERLLAGTKRVLVGVTTSVPSCYENCWETWLQFFILW